MQNFYIYFYISTFFCTVLQVTSKLNITKIKKYLVQSNV